MSEAVIYRARAMASANQTISKPLGKMGPRFVVHDNPPEASTTIKIVTVAAAFFLSLTILGIPLAGYLIYRVRGESATPMDSNRMLGVFKHAVKQHKGEGYLDPSKAASIGKSQESPQSLALTIGQGEDIGKSRKTMEDAKFYVENDRRLLIGVFDGHDGSDTSKYAAAQFETRFDEYVNRFKGNIEKAFQQLVDDIHKEVLKKEYGDGTTAVISYLDKSSNRLYTATLGDSEGNIYREVDGKMVSVPLSLTQNWTLDSELERLSKYSGVSKKDILDAAKSKQEWRGGSLDKIIRSEVTKNQHGIGFNGINLSRSIGDVKHSGVTSRKVEVTSIQVKPGDTIILACDGLKDYAKEKEIVKAVKQGKASPAQLIELAKQGMTEGDGDNVTVITVKVEKAPEKKVDEDLEFSMIEDDRKVSSQELDEKEKNRMISQVRNPSIRLGSETVIAYAEHLKKTLSFEFIPELLRLQAIDVSKLVQTNKPVFIPVILDTRNNHIVLITIDPKNKTIEYFDSQGKALELEKRKIIGQKKTPADLVASMNLEGYERVSNKKGYQFFWDTKNCGVFVSKFMQARAQKNFVDACGRMRLGWKELRGEMAKELA